MYETFAEGPTTFHYTFGLVFGIVMLISNWKLFTKAGKPGWACIVPIYNIIVYLQIIEKPLWWFFMGFIPGVNIVFGFMALYHFLKKFGKPGSHVIWAFIFAPIYFPILAFSSAEYQD